MSLTFTSWENYTDHDGNAQVIDWTSEETLVHSNWEPIVEALRLAALERAKIVATSPNYFYFRTTAHDGNAYHTTTSYPAGILSPVTTHAPLGTTTSAANVLAAIEIILESTARCFVDVYKTSGDFTGMARSLPLVFDADFPYGADMDVFQNYPLVGGIMDYCDRTDRVLFDEVGYLSAAWAFQTYQILRGMKWILGNASWLKWNTSTKPSNYGVSTAYGIKYGYSYNGSFADAVTAFDSDSWGWPKTAYAVGVGGHGISYLDRNDPNDYWHVSRLRANTTITADYCGTGVFSRAEDIYANTLYPNISGENNKYDDKDYSSAVNTYIKLASLSAAASQIGETTGYRGNIDEEPTAEPSYPASDDTVSYRGWRTHTAVYRIVKFDVTGGLVFA